MYPTPKLYLTLVRVGCHRRSWPPGESRRPSRRRPWCRPAAARERDPGRIDAHRGEPNCAASRQSSSMSRRVASGLSRVWSIIAATPAGAPPAAWTPSLVAPASRTVFSRSGQQSVATAWHEQRDCGRASRGGHFLHDDLDQALQLGLRHDGVAPDRGSWPVAGCSAARASACSARRRRSPAPLPASPASRRASARSRRCARARSAQSFRSWPWPRECRSPCSPRSPSQCPPHRSRCRHRPRGARRLVRPRPRCRDSPPASTLSVPRSSAVRPRPRSQATRSRRSAMPVWSLATATVRMSAAGANESSSAVAVSSCTTTTRRSLSVSSASGVM